MQSHIHIHIQRRRRVRGITTTELLRRVFRLVLFCFIRPTWRDFRLKISRFVLCVAFLWFLFYLLFIFLLFERQKQKNWNCRYIINYSVQQQIISFLLLLLSLSVSFCLALFACLRKLLILITTRQRCQVRLVSSTIYFCGNFQNIYQASSSASASSLAAFYSLLCFVFLGTWTTHCTLH